MTRWVFVGAVGVLCGALLAGLLLALTANVVAAVVVGAGVAGILLGLAWGGARHNETFRQTPDRARDAAAKRRRVQEAMRESRRTPD